jgi:hypothetical protein
MIVSPEVATRHSSLERIGYTEPQPVGLVGLVGFRENRGWNHGIHHHRRRGNQGWPLFASGPRDKHSSIVRKPNSGPKQLEKSVGVHRAGKEETLEGLASYPLEESKLGLSLHPFRNHMHIKLFRHPDNRF